MTTQQIDDIVKIYNNVSMRDPLHRRLWAAHVYAKHTRGVKFRFAYEALSKRLGKLCQGEEYRKDMLLGRELISDDIQIDNKLRKFALRQLILRSLIRTQSRIRSHRMPHIEEIEIQKIFLEKLKSI